MQKNPARGALSPYPAIGVIIAIFCLLCSLWLLWPILTTPSWYAAKQSYRYPYLLAMFTDQFLAGQWYPRWLPGLEGGYGYPTFVFYPPGFWFLALPFALLTSNMVAACKMALLALAVVGGLGAYKLARCFCGHAFAMVATALFYTTPYFAKQIYDRGSLAELTATFLCPWVFYHLVMAARSGDSYTSGRHAIWLGLCLAATMYAHPIVATWLAVALVPCAIGAAYDANKFRRSMALFFASAALALILSAPYWWSALEFKDAVTYQDGLGSMAFANVKISTIFSFEKKLMGPGFAVMAIAGAWFGRRSWFLVTAITCCIVFTAYMTEWSFSARHAIVALQYLQMPYRVLSVVATLQLACIASLFGEIEHRWTWRFLPVMGFVMVAVLIFSQRPFYRLHGTLNYEQFRAAKTSTFENMTHTDEFMPNTATLHGLSPREPDSPIATISNNGTLSVVFNRADTDIALKAESSAPGRILINQFYFPGWRVEVDGNPIHTCTSKKQKTETPLFCQGKNGRIKIRIPQPGTYFVNIKYDGVPGAAARSIMAIMALTVSAGLLLWIGRRKTAQRH